MRVEFKYTIDDLVDAHLRLLKHSPTVRAWRWRDLVVASLLSGGLLFALIREEITVRIIVGSIGLLLGAVFYLAVNSGRCQERPMKAGRR